MSTLNEFSKESLPALLATNIVDASDGILFGANREDAIGIAPATENRTIIIGLGGTGVETVDKIKGEIKKRMQPTWHNYIAFLAIDSDDSYFTNATHLDKSSETVNITRNGVDNRAQNPAMFPAAWPSVTKRKISSAALAGNGCSRKRLYGRMKIHDQAPSVPGVDEDIILKIKALASGLSAITSGSGSYEVFVIGSGSGGTCSGGLLEMPFLVRTALSTDNAPINIYPMVFLPEHMTALDPNNASVLRANGYATLKELNYFQSITMRDGYSEIKYRNGNPKEMPISSSQGVFSVPYLIETRNGGAVGSLSDAQTELAEFLISLVAKVDKKEQNGNPSPFDTRSFLNNGTETRGNKSTMPTDSSKEAAGEYHEFAKHYGAIGFAKAAIPKDLVYSYEVGQICLKSGLIPISEADRAALPTDVMLPFRGSENLFAKSVGESHAQNILASVKNLLDYVYQQNFEFARDLNQTPPTFETIRGARGIASVADNPMITKLRERYIEQNTTDVSVSKRIEEEISKKYAEFETAVRKFVKEEGPYAFVELFDGHFITQGSEYGIGIRAMLENLRDGKLLNGKTYAAERSISAVAAKENLDLARKAVNECNILVDITKVKPRLADTWITAYNTWVNACVNEKRKELILGVSGLFDVHFIRKAILLRERLLTFADILITISNGYISRGKNLENFTDFENSSDSSCEINIGANVTSYNWIKRQSEQAVAAIKARDFRDKIVDNFFDNPTEWISVPDGYVIKKSNADVLVSQKRPVPARACFDKLIAEEIRTLDISVKSMFSQLQASGVSVTDTIRDIVKELYAKSKIPAPINVNSNFSYILYPSTLAIEGSEIISEITKIAQEPTLFGTGVEICSSDDADSIMAYQQAVPFEIYHLQNLALWEANYEAQIPTSVGVDALDIHGLSPAICAMNNGTLAYDEIIPWTDFPPLVDHHNEIKPDPKTGMFTREGKFLVNLEKTLREAEALGVLYCQEEAGGFQYYRVYCDKSTQWEFDISQIGNVADVEDIQGKNFATHFMNMNGRNLNEASCKVALSEGGVMSRPAATKEDAWEHTRRILRVHIPMLLEIYETVKVFKEAYQSVEAFIKQLQEKKKPIMMLNLIRAGVLNDNGGLWELNMPNGTKQNVANFSEKMLPFLKPEDKKKLSNGLMYYLLFTKLDIVLKKDFSQFAELNAESQNAYQNLLNAQDMDSLTTFNDRVNAAMAEKQELASQGATFDGQISRTFINAMQSVTTDMDELTAIEFFYSNLEN